MLARLLRCAVALLLASPMPLAVPGQHAHARQWVQSSDTTLPTVAGSEPDIVLILTDDQRWDMLGHMPNVHHLLMDHGITFTNGFVVNSLCCPSRTTILTGEYSHSTGVYTDGDPYGGYHAFHDGSTIATWLDDAGYETGLMGKYLNKYDDARVPPGWNRWFAFQKVGADERFYYDYHVVDQGVLRPYGADPKDYSTNVLANKAVRFIDDAHGPLFLYLAPFAPHGPATPAPADVSRFSHLAPARPPSYDEPDVSDKPEWVRTLPQLSRPKREQTDAIRVDRFRTLLSVDRMVGRVVDALERTGRLSHTMIVFTSDNGIHQGEHRWANRKETAYEESIRIPFVVRYDPMITAPRTDDHLVLNLDLAPTFADAAGVDAPGAEGSSLLPILASPSAPWRHDFLIEHLATSPRPPTYCAVRTTRFLYVEYQGGDEELYDLRTDPFELDNAAAEPEMARILDRLRARTRELCEPPPPGFEFSH